MPQIQFSDAQVHAYKALTPQMAVFTITLLGGAEQRQLYLQPPYYILGSMLLYEYGYK